MRSSALILAAALVASPACKPSHAPTSAAAHSPRGDAAPAAKPAKAPAAEANRTAAKGPIHWLDSYRTALARARAARKPLVIDMSARWCDTCLSMQSTVLADPSLGPLAGRFIWAAIDVDKPENAALVAKFQIHSWPTYCVVNPESEAVEALHIGAASVAGFRRFLRRGERGTLDDFAGAGKLAKGSPLALERAGDRALNKGDVAAADKAYAAALAAAPASWGRRPEVLLSRLESLAALGRFKECAALAGSALDETGETNTAADFASVASACAGQLRDAAAARRLRERLVARISTVLATSHVMSVDDRSNALEAQRDIYDALHQPDMARKVARRQQQLLDKAAAAAPTPFLKMTYDGPRSDVYVYLDEGKKLIPDLVKSVHELPHEYDPPYRLAYVYYSIGEQDRAATMIARALSLAYGQRRATVGALAVKIQKARGDVAAERKALSDLIATYASLPRGEKDPGGEKQARAELAALGKGRKQTAGGAAHATDRRRKPAGKTTAHHHR